MADIRIRDDEEWIGAGHPTKPDVLNRPGLGGITPTFRDTDGKNLKIYHKAVDAAPSTGVDEVARYARRIGGVLRLCLRLESDGAEIVLG